MITSSTSAERTARLRYLRAAAGLRRLELWAHPLDWPRIKRLSVALRQRRERMARKRDRQAKSAP